MDVFEIIEGRRSVREFKTEENVSEKDLEKLIDAARWAPSAGNVQPWEFIIVRRLEIKRGLTEAAFGQSFIEQAAAVIIVCADENRSSERYGQRGKSLYCIQDTAAAIENIHLAAFFLGLSTCWVGAFKEEEAKKILKTPKGIRPIAMIPVGYSEKSPTPPARRAVKNMVHYEAFGS